MNNVKPTLQNVLIAVNQLEMKAEQAEQVVAIKSAIKYCIETLEKEEKKDDNTET